MDVDRIVELLKQCSNEETSTRESAEKKLFHIHKIIGFSAKLIEIVLSDRFEWKVRFAASNCLKENVIKYWDSNNMLGDNVAPDLLKLIISDIPKEFKIALLDLCAAFSKSAPSTALSLWNKLEILIPTLNKRCGTVPGISCGILNDIGDQEPKTQEYPITISFMRMLNNILEHIAYYCLLQSPHVQQNNCLEACINLVSNFIFLKVNSRQFNQTEDRWTILNLCIETFQLFISRYEPAEDGNAQKCSFTLTSQILQDSDIFKCIMQNLEDAVNLLENSLIQTKTEDTENQSSTYKPDPLVDKYIYTALNLFNDISKKQDDFMEVIKSIPGYPTATNSKLNVLFNGVNHRTGYVDRLVSLIRIPALCLDESSLQALSLFTSLVRDQPSLAQQVSVHLSSSGSPLVHDDNLVTLYVNCLSSDCKQVRRAALEFISTCLNHRAGVGKPTYNLAHELLGFDAQMTTLREPGSMGKVFDCLHAIIGFFDLETFDHPELKEERTLGLEIIYKLCIDVRTCDLILRFLRSSYDFLSKYLKELFKRNIFLCIEDRITEMIWFLRIIAVEIKLSCERNMVSIASGHLKMLLAEKPRKLLELIPDFVCGQTHPIMPNWECFDTDELWKIIAEQADKTTTIDLKELHTRLAGEVKMINLQLGTTQKNLIRDEISEIIDFATSLNHSHQQQRKKCEYFNAWRELTEVIISVNALDEFDSDMSVRILFEIIHELMSKTKITNFTSSLIIQLSSTILLATSQLRSRDPKTSSTTDFVSLARSIQKLLEQSSTLLWGQFKQARVNLYAAFLHASRALPETVCNDLKFNHALLEKIYRDSLIGPEIVKVLSLTILTQTDLAWVDSAARDGSLRHLIESLSEDDLEVVTTRGEVVTKEFYSLDSKLSLVNKIAATHSGAINLVHSNLMEVLNSLKTIDSYLMLLEDNSMFQRLFVGVMRLMRTVSTTMKINNKNLYRVKPIIHSEILRNIPVLKSTPGGIETLLHTTSLQSQIIIEMDSNVQHDFVNAVQHFTDYLTEDLLKILANILTGCIKILHHSNQTPLPPLFASSWNSSSSPTVLLSQPSVGTLVSIINHLRDQQHSPTDSVKEIVRESCIYLIWAHVSIYLNPDYKTKSVREIETFKGELPITLNDAFFNNLAFSRSQFVEMFSRKVKKLKISVM